MNDNLLRAKTTTLISTGKLTPQRQKNSDLNMEEMMSGIALPNSKPRRLVFELTNSCNLNCIMCGRNAAEFKPTFFKYEWFDFFAPIMSEIEEVTLMGWGEPTIHPDFVKMLETLHKLGVRKYFCTNGMRLDKLTPAIFENEVEVFAVSLDGANAQINEIIRRGCDFDKIVSSLKEIVKIKKSKNLSYPYINFVFTAMKRNLHEIPAMVRLAAEIGIQEVKVVYLTAFDDVLAEQILYDSMDEVAAVFDEAEKVAQELGIFLKLPHICGNDPANDKCHKDCYTLWRDFFLGSDGYVRSCMSSPEKLFAIDKYDSFDEAWHSQEIAQLRAKINSDEMPNSCKRCYQSSHANWNNKSSFDQRENVFSPKWE